MKYNLLICSRPIMQTDKRSGTIPLEHCYAKLQNQDGQIIDSISYDGSTGVSQGKKSNQTTEANCQSIKQISKQQWDTLTESISEQCKPEEYSLADNNCCSCLRDVVKTQIGTVPKNIDKALKDIELKKEYVKLV